MSDVVAYHPVTEAQAQVPEESMQHLRQSGWLLLEEHLANTAAAEAREKAEAEAEAAVSKTAAKKGQ